MSTPIPPEGSGDRDPYGNPPQPGRDQPGQPAYGQQPYQQAPGYGQQPYGGYGGPGGYGGQGGEPRPARNGLGWAALILGILGIVSFWLLVGGLFGLLAIILGIVAWQRSSKGQATNGWAGIVGIVLGTLALVGAILMGILVGAVWNSEEGQNLRDCLSDAGTDRAAQEECERRFEDEIENGGNSSMRLVVR